MKNILFYKYVPIKNIEQFRDEHFKFCESLNLKGKILVATEGINGCITGKEKDIQTYKNHMKQDSRFHDIEFKEAQTINHNFKKLIVRIRSEVVTSHLDVDLKHKAQYIEPEELKQLLDNNEDVILVDARNDYESKVGRFKGAVCPEIQIFSDFPKVAEQLKDKKEKKIITYCTGGIRCEKASAYLKEQGFTNVSQLHGGIIKYGIVNGDEHWEGKCFVFDDRVVIDIDPQKQTEPITRCTFCNIPEAMYHNCAITECDKRYIACDNCRETFNECCSKKCSRELLIVEN